MRRLKVALNHPKRIGQFIAFARFIASRMANNPFFPSPNVPIATLFAQIEELAAAQALTLSRRGTGKARDASYQRVLASLMALKTYVERVANERRQDGEVLIASAGMSVKQTRGPNKPLFKVKQLKTSGWVRLEVRHPGRVATFYWQRSIDGKTWIDEEDSVVAHLDVHGLTPGVLYWFRYRVRTSKGLGGDWSDPITLLVV
jgi:hypothetical protein